MNHIYETRGRVTPHPRVHYLDHEFDVPAGTTAIHATLQYRKERVCQLYLSLFDPNGFRGCHMQPGAQGDIELPLHVATDGASRGGIAGPIPAGRWRVQIDIGFTNEEQDYHLTVEAANDGPAGPALQPYPDDYVSKAEPGWYRGELHSHSHESDGKVPVSEVVAAARHYGLAFLALTDHFTTSGYADLGKLVGPDLALMRSMELTGHFGHANLHGLHRWHDVYVDGRDDWDINAVAREVRDAGGLFCVNHPFSSTLGWRYHEFDWNNADLLEVYHHLEGANNMYQVGLWDEQLRAGRRIVGVAGIDSHHPHEQRHRLGQVFTVIYAPELSERGLIAGLRSGRVYATRGPELALHAESSAGTAEIGGEIADGDLCLHAEVRGMRFPFRLFVLKNGMYCDHMEQHDAPAASERFSVEDRARSGDYYRIEVHAIFPNEDTPWKHRRDWESLIGFTNPVFVV